MQNTQKLILVTGATGQQGGAVARHLLAKGYRVRAFTRNADTFAAQVLRLAGAEVVEGDYDNRDSLDIAMEGIDGVFSVQPSEYSPGFTPVGFGYPDEVRQGRNIADAAQKAGVGHFVYSSAAGAEHLKGTRNYSKWEMEEYIRAIQLPATILRPVWFMENFTDPLFGLQTGTFSTAIKPDVAIQLIAADDIGAFAAIAFQEPDNFIGKSLEIAGDALTPSQIVSAINGVKSGPIISYTQIPVEIIRQHSSSAARVYEVINETGYNADIPTLRTLHPGLMNFDNWLQKEGKIKFNALTHTNAS